MSRFDVAIVGGGPSGSTTALCLARKGWGVALFESTSFDRERPGETLPPEIYPVLRDLEVCEAFVSLSPIASSGIVSIWGEATPHEQDFVCNVHGSGWHVDRNRFDEMLFLQAEKAGASVFPATRVGGVLREESGGWALECRSAGPVGLVRSRFLVDASGRLGLRIAGGYDWDVDDWLLAIALRVCVNEGVLDSRAYIESTPRGWWYSAPLHEGVIAAMFFTSSEIWRRNRIIWQEELRAAPLTRRRMQSGALANGRVIYVRSALNRCIAGEARIAVGDSASTYDPLSGMGVFKALRQGKKAAEAVDACLRSDVGSPTRYAECVSREFERYVAERRRYYSAERRWAGEPFWRARQRMPALDPCLPENEAGNLFR